MEQNIKKLGELIEKSQKIALISHIRMDPDTFGSMMGLYYILKKIGKNVIALNSEGVAENFAFLGANHEVQTSVDLKNYNPDIIISLDAASKEQLGSIYQTYQEVFEEKDFIVIDHHITNQGFGNINIIDTQASSTCELVFSICEILSYTQHIDSHIATLLNAGILTDTNMYYNTNTTAKTLLVASKLIEYGSQPREAMFEFFKKKGFQKSKLWGEVLKGIQKTDDGKIVWASVKKEVFQNTSTTSHDISGLINEFLANIEGSQISFILYELEEGGTKASFRSNGYNIGEFCAQFGGGGHKQAAGFTSQKPIDNIEKDILEVLSKGIQNS